MQLGWVGQPGIGRHDTVFSSVSSRHTSHPALLISCQARFCQIEITLNTPQRVVINHALISQTDDRLPFNVERFPLQTLILRRGDFAAAVVGVLGAKL